MIRTPLFPVVAVILAVSLLMLSAPLAAQEKPAGTAEVKDPAAAPKTLAATSKSIKKTTGGPSIFFPEAMHDFGTIARGSKVSHIFKVINNGDEPLKLIKAKGT